MPPALRPYERLSPQWTILPGPGGFPAARRVQFGCGRWGGSARSRRPRDPDGLGRSRPVTPEGTQSGDEVFGLRVVADDGRGRLLGVQLEPLAHLDADAFALEELDHLCVV